MIDNAKYLAIATHIQQKIDWLSEERLRWAIFKSDMLSYRKTGKSITGASWMKSENGPIPSFREKSVA